MQQWLKYFEQNRDHRLPVPWERGLKVEAHLREPLIRSLQKFQIGESGDGRNLRRHAAETGDAVYARTIELFVKEENEHARLMAEILQRLDAPLLTGDWTDNCFKLMRHLFGLREELFVLLLPEMIAKRYFRALRDGTGDPILRAVCEQIVRDEEGHVAFHVEYLRRVFEHLSFSQRIAIQVAWRIAFRATCLVVMFDHRDVLRACGVKPGDFWHGCGRVFDETAAGIFSPANVLAPARLAMEANG
ncbi:MAG: ferritin-like domain-containing protein [Pedosphaera sp.]|nr:ferritin-like domain-containing protein [Pedosphaera sp.]